MTQIEQNAEKTRRTYLLWIATVLFLVWLFVRVVASMEQTWHHRMMALVLSDFYHGPFFFVVFLAFCAHANRVKRAQLQEHRTSLPWDVNP